MTDLKNLIKTLSENDIGFYCSHPAPGGSRTLHLSPEQLLSYMQDPVAYLAQIYGVTRQQYLGWNQSDYSVKCAGKTSAGKSCKNTVPNGSFTEPKEWVSLQGSYCHVHQ